MEDKYEIPDNLPIPEESYILWLKIGLDPFVCE